MTPCKSSSHLCFIILLLYELKKTQKWFAQKQSIRLPPSLTPGSCFEARRLWSRWLDYLEFFLAIIPSRELLPLLSDPLYWPTDWTLQPLSLAHQGCQKGKVWLQINQVNQIIIITCSIQVNSFLNKPFVNVILRVPLFQGCCTFKACRVENYTGIQYDFCSFIVLLTKKCKYW